MFGVCTSEYAVATCIEILIKINFLANLTGECTILVAIVIIMSHPFERCQPMKLTTTRWRTACANMKSPKALSGVILLNSALF